MTDLLALLSELGRWALPAVWLPVLVWTLVAGAVLVSLRLVRPVHAVIAYPLHLALLLGLPLVLLARPLTRTLAPSSVSTAIGSVLLPPVAASNGAAGFETPLLPLAAGLGVIVALAVTLGGFLRLALAARRLRRYGQALVRDAALQDAFAQTDTTRAEPKDRDAYVMVDEPPVLIGGLEGVLEELQYPALARQAGIQGTVFVQFVVDESGVPVDAEVVRSTANAADGDGGLAAEALRVVRQARFEPGRHEGEPVKVGFTLPIRFELPGGSASPTPEGSGAPSPVQRLFDRWEEHNDERHDEEHR